MKPRTLTRAALTLAFGATLGCGGGAAGTPATGNTPTADAAPQRGNRNVLLAEEILKTGQSNAFRAIQVARPQWLLTRPTGSPRGGYEQLQVYVEGNHMGAASSLEQITAISIKELRFLDAREATTRFGTGHGGGAVLVTLAR